MLHIIIFFFCFFFLQECGAVNGWIEEGKTGPSPVFLNTQVQTYFKTSTPFSSTCIYSNMYSFLVFFLRDTV
jgi:hypothetical protein